MLNSLKLGLIWPLAIILLMGVAGLQTTAAQEPPRLLIEADSAVINFDSIRAVWAFVNN